MWGLKSLRARGYHFRNVPYTALWRYWAAGGQSASTRFAFVISAKKMARSILLRFGHAGPASPVVSSLGAWKGMAERGFAAAALLKSLHLALHEKSLKACQLLPSNAEQQRPGSSQPHHHFHKVLT